MVSAPLAFLACVLIWGSTWMAIKVGYEGIGALTGAALRFGLAALVLAAVAVATRRPLRLRGVHLRLALFVGFATFLVDYGLIYWGEQSLSSGLTAVLFATVPFSAGLLAWRWLGDRPTPRKLGGALVGFLGLALLFREGLIVDAGQLAPMLAVLVAAVGASASNVATKRWGHDLDPISLFATAMGAGSLGLFAWALAAGEALSLPRTPVAWASVLYLALFGSVIAFVLYYRLIPRYDVVKLSLIAVLIPLVALALGVAFLGERFGLAETAGVALVLLGVGVAITAPPRPSRTPAGAPADGA